MGKFVSRLFANKGTQGKSNQSKTSCVVYRPLEFHWPPWLSLFQYQATNSDGNNPDTYMMLVCFHRKNLSPLGQSKCQWTYDQKSLPNIRRAIQFHAKAIAAQQQSLDSLDKTALDNYIALDYLLVEQGGFYAIANTTCCTWTNVSGKVETQIYKMREQMHWLQQISPNSPWSFNSPWSICLVGHLQA